MLNTALEYAHLGDIDFALRPGFIVQRVDGAKAKVSRTEGFGSTFVAYVEWQAENGVRLAAYDLDGRTSGSPGTECLAGVWKHVDRKPN